MIGETTQDTQVPGGGPMEAAVRKARATQEAARAREQKRAEERTARLEGKKGIDKAVDTLIQSKKTTQERLKSGVKPSGTTPRDYLQSLSTPSAVKQTIEGLKGK